MKFKITITILLISLLVACGGGGGGGSSDGDDPDPSPTPEISESPTPTPSPSSSPEPTTTPVPNPDNVLPTVSAGEDQSVPSLSQVSLSGSASDSDGVITSYHWTQVSGPAATIESADNLDLVFTAPAVAVETLLTFRLTVEDNDGGVAFDDVVVSLSPSGVYPIAAVGLPAAGFPEGYVYWGVHSPSIGRQGHIAFYGAADESIQSTDANTNAVWAGLPGDIQPIVKENGTLSGLAANILFDSWVSTNPPIVSTSGYVAFRGILKGAVDNTNNTGFFAYVDNELHLVMRPGDPAPGLDGAYVGNILNMAFSDAGMVLQGLLTDSATMAIWFWDKETLHLVAVDAGYGTYEFDVSQAYAANFGDACRIFTILGNTGLQINDRGDILFTPIFENQGSSTTCPNAKFAVMRWREGDFYDVCIDGQQVPGMDSSYFSITATGLLLQQMNLSESGDVAVSSIVKTGSDITSGNWVFKENGDFELISLAGETMPYDATKSIRNNMTGSYGNGPQVDGNGEYFIGEQEADSLTEVFLKGPSRVNPYTDVTDVGGSQLSLLLMQTDVPPGQEATAYWTSFYYAKQFRCSYNYHGNLVFQAQRADASESGSEVSALWFQSETAIKEILTVGEQYTINGQPSQLISADFGGGALGKGARAQFSDTNQVVVEAQLLNYYRAILLITP